MRHIFLASAIMVLLGGAAMAEPSFDCTKAQSSAEEAVCGSDALAALDNELARLFKLAVNGPNMDTARLNELKATERGWIKGRDDCWKSSFSLETCVVHEYALRIFELRQGYADARSEDGVSEGPFAYRCNGLDATVGAVFVNTSGPLVALRWAENHLVLPRVESASGAKYASDEWYGGPASFWMKGRAAVFAAPGGPEMTCAQDDIG